MLLPTPCAQPALISAILSLRDPRAAPPSERSAPKTSIKRVPWFLSSLSPLSPRYSGAPLSPHHRHGRTPVRVPTIDSDPSCQKWWQRRQRCPDASGCRTSPKALRHSAVESRYRAIGPEPWERKCDKARRRCEVCAACSSPNTSPATPIDGARHPVWVLNGRHIERASISRWQGIRAGAPPTLLLARNPRAAEQRDTSSTRSARDYPTPKRSIARLAARW